MSHGEVYTGTRARPITSEKAKGEEGDVLPLHPPPKALATLPCLLDIITAYAGSLDTREHPPDEEGR